MDDSLGQTKPCLSAAPWRDSPGVSEMTVRLNLMLGHEVILCDWSALEFNLVVSFLRDTKGYIGPFIERHHVLSSGMAMRIGRAVLNVT